MIAVADTVKASAKEAIQQLSSMNIRTVMLTGDNERTAKAIVKEVGIDQVIAGVLPEDKAHHITQLQEQKHNVAMVGDGINDAPALVKADIGIAMGTGTEVAIEAADITILGGDIQLVPKAIHASHKTIAILNRTYSGHLDTTLQASLLRQWDYLPLDSWCCDGLKFS